MDPDGRFVFAIPIAIAAAKATAWFVGSLALCAAGGYVFGKTAENVVEYIKSNKKTEENGSSDKPSPMPEDGTKSGTKDNHGGSVPDDPNVTGHIFDPKKEGHLPEDTPENRRQLNDVGNDEESYLGRDQYGNDWHGRVNEDGSQTWTESRNGRIFDGGVNKVPKTFDPKTGLKSSERPW